MIAPEGLGLEAERRLEAVIAGMNEASDDALFALATLPWITSACLFAWFSFSRFSLFLGEGTFFFNLAIVTSIAGAEGRG
jgi:hypothetical protein